MLGVTATAMRYSMVVYVLIKVYLHWAKPTLGALMEIPYWILADLTTRGQEALPDKIGNPDCR
jgi:hypothetical protein